MIYILVNRRMPISGFLIGTGLAICLWLPLFIVNLYEYFINGKRG